MFPTPQPVSSMAHTHTVLCGLHPHGRPMAQQGHRYGRLAFLPSLGSVCWDFVASLMGWSRRASAGSGAEQPQLSTPGAGTPQSSCCDPTCSFPSSPLPAPAPQRLAGDLADHSLWALGQTWGELSFGF